MLHQIVELQVRLCLDDMQVARLIGDRLQSLDGARMRWKNHRQATCRRTDRTQQSGEACGIIDIGRTMHRQDEILLRAKLQLTPEGRRSQPIHTVQQRADHDGAGLLRLRLGPDLQIDIRLSNPELGKKIAGHASVVVLPGVHQPRA